MLYIGQSMFALMLVVFKCLGGKNQTESMISVDKIIILLERFHKIKIKRRWVFRILQLLELFGYIRRQIRPGRQGDGTFARRSSLIYLTGKYASYLMSKGVSGAKALLERIIEGAKSKDKRFPSTEAHIKQCNKKMDEQERRLWGNPIANMVPGYD